MKPEDAVLIMRGWVDRGCVLVALLQMPEISFVARCIMRSASESRVELTCIVPNSANFWFSLSDQGCGIEYSEARDNPNTQWVSTLSEEEKCRSGLTISFRVRSSLYLFETGVSSSERPAVGSRRL
jgi:hypothetical protein